MNSNNIRNISTFILIILLFMLGCSSDTLRNPIIVTVVFSTDTMGNIFPCGCRVPLGGIAERGYEINRIKTGTKYMLVLDNGNALWGPNSLVEQSDGLIISKSMNRMGYDVLNFRSSDLAYYREPKLRKLIDSLNCEVVSANLKLKDSQIKLKQFTIKEVGGVKFGIIGISEAYKYEQGRYEFEKPEYALKRLIPEVREKSDIVIVLSGADYRHSTNLAHMVDGIDVIVCPPPQRPVLNSLKIKDTIVVTTIKHGKSLGILELGINTDKKIADHKFRMNNIHENMPKDQKISDLIKEFKMNEE